MIKLGVIEVERPKVYFREKSHMPQKIELKIVRPPTHAHLDDKAFSEMLKDAVEMKEKDIRETAMREGRRFLGARKVMRQNPKGAPTTEEESGGLNPRIAAKDKWQRMEALRRMKSWQDAYRRAWEKWKNGMRDVEFPVGTYAVVRFAGARCVDT